MTGPAATTIEVQLSELGEALFAVRLCTPEARQQMQLSLAKQGQVTPVQAYRCNGGLEVIDGFKRLQAARALSWPKLRVEVQQVDDPGAKVRLWQCNAGPGLSELEEAWLVRAMYRDDKLTQPQIGRLLGRHKSWVCRRLMLAEGLSDAVTADVRLGLLSATVVRELARLPRGNQEAAAQVAAQRGLTSRQVARLVDGLLGADEPERQRMLDAVGDKAEAGASPKGGAKTRTPGEQLAADAFAIKRLVARLHVLLLERPLSSLGIEAAVVAARELVGLSDALGPLCSTLEKRLAEAQEQANTWMR